ncbi:aconitate hydratase [Aminithiophilus ramosus]|uniref:Aconitate hydratase n=2 Tax=Synergistales TaxID=649776 RepID=A0A9Q7EYI6_9BACT|nr:aconitate hydratase [Aminithiophilus ramosus]QTX32051.1 aconitate hydratase [Aminithiophilus ramosus]QVL35891.1 aconitate hydratase [Synergistota bacterium]
MGQTVAEKILSRHLVSGDMEPGRPIALRMDQTLTQDATGTMAYLQFEAIGVDRVRTELSVSYVDHNMIQGDYRNPDDHRYLQDVAAKYGILFSPAGNGICHQLHLERFAVPGKTLIGSDSHTPTAGGLTMIAIGAGGLDVALAMAGEPFVTPMPRITLVRLVGTLQPFVSAKDVILEVLRRITVKGGVGRILEYGGPGVEGLSVPDRATITNMGAETGATSSVFPSDEVTRRWLRSQGRESSWVELSADADARYDTVIDIDLSTLEPLVAQPFQPDRVVPVRELAGLPVDQVMFGSCTNSSLRDIESVAHILEGRRIAPTVDAGISPGSRQVILEAARTGAFATLVASGVRLLEVSCGACIGMGFAPPTEGVSLRTINRNFLGRCGHKTGKVYLVSPEVAAASAVTGVLTDPRDLAREEGIEPFSFAQPDAFLVDDSRFVAPADEPETVTIRRGPNIAPLPPIEAMAETVRGEVLLKVGDDITTDHIMPAGAKILPLRSNIPAIARHVFEVVDASFHDRALAKGGGFVVGGANYGQGSSREHAALAPRYLGVRAVLAKSFARIHLANLVNCGILPLLFQDPSDYDAVEAGDALSLNRREVVTAGSFPVRNERSGRDIPCTTPISEEDLAVVLAGGKLNWVRSKKAERL